MANADGTAAEASDAAVEERAYKKVFGRLVPFLMLCYGVAYLDRVNLGFAKLQMAGELKFDDTVYGLGAGIFFIGYFLFEVPSNLLLRRVGARRWIARIMITWGIVSGLCAFIRTPTMFYTLRFLLGLAEAGFYPGIILYLTYWYPAARFGRATAAFMVAVPLSGVVGNPLSGWIMDGTHGFAGLHGWQWMFLLEALPSIAMGVVVLFYLNDGIRDAHWLTDGEKRVLEQNIARDEAEKRGPESVLAAFADGRLWLCALIYFSVVAGLYGLGFWMPTLVSATGVRGNFLIGCLSAIPNVVAVVAMVLLGRSADARRERRWHFVAPALAGAAGLIGAALMAHNAVVAIASLSLAAAGIISCLPLFWSLPTAFLRGMGAAAGIAGINAVGNLAGFVGPSMVGFLRDATHDNRIAMYALAGIVTIGAVAVLRMRPEVVNR
ncbi:MAG TPA: MFS transporter [Opitutus sp.]|nr:MFS transporter [Opitutus sp.]